ncbi:MAG TPA: DEAD/DEAH box helicase [Bdellovibrionales bacterium]|nr:DEAD/DEAH box helicase [Bdellovibrionales bacterium]
MFTLRPYQELAVRATLRHFRRERTPAVVVLPTGAGKSLVIAELARRARGRVLVLAHVRELVEQNFAKYQALGLDAGIFSAGLDRKDSAGKTIFGSIQSVARAPGEFFADFSLVVIDECHRVAMEGETQYRQVLSKIRDKNPECCVLGLTATPYRLGAGWIYECHEPRKIQRTRSERFFKKCIFELTMRQMIAEGYLTPPVLIDSPVACYDFSSLKLHGGRFNQAQIEQLLKDQKRITPVIIANIIEMSRERQGVMIFTASVAHAREIMRSLPPFVSALIVGETGSREREETIAAFKQKRLKFLVNVSVLTTGFDAPHVDVIAILRPTESDSLYQQIVGRGLRLSPGKTDCLILDYTGQDHDLYSPQIDQDKPSSGAVIVDVPCPKCGAINQFWGIQNEDGFVEEHFGRKCQGAADGRECGFLFRFKRCDQCGSENDIAARKCRSCAHALIDDDRKLKEAMALKDAHVMRVDSMHFAKSRDKRGGDRLEVRYFDADANVLKEYYYLDSKERRQAFYLTFARMHLRVPEMNLDVHTVEDVLALADRYRAPMFVIARKKKHFWAVREKIF